MTGFTVGTHEGMALGIEDIDGLPPTGASKGAEEGGSMANE